MSQHGNETIGAAKLCAFVAVAIDYRPGSDYPDRANVDPANANVEGAL